MKNNKLKLVFTCFLVILSSMAAFPAIGQNQQGKKIQIKGIVTDEKDEPMIGVVIRTKDSSTGTISDINGGYVIDVPDRTVLIFSLLGYLPHQEEVNGQKNINVKMVPAENEVSEVVVTALGIKKEKKKLAYAVQDVSSENLSKIPVPNLASNLTGRIAGMKVSNSTNLFDQPQILLRGVAPKIVVDGVPVESATFFEISPEDIESMNVLKGPAAAVLYGQMGQNGVIQITTKKAKGASKISVNSATTFDIGLIAKPSYQTKYGTGYQGKYEAGNTTDEFWGAWGPELDGRLLPQWNSPRDENGNRVPIPWIARGANNLENMMETGFTTSNNVSFETKSDKGDFRASFSQMHQKGVFENTKLNSFTLNLSGGAQLTSKLRFDATINYNKLNSPNYPSLGYGRNSPIYTVILWTGTNVDVRDLKNYWVPGMEGLQQRNFDIGPGYDNGSYDYNNPFFVLNENLKGYYKDMVFGSTSLKYDVNKEWNVTLRTALNVNSLQQDQKIAYSTVGQRRGNYSQTFNNDFQSISDLIVKYSKRFGDFGLDAMGGGNMRIYNDRYTSASTDGLSVPGIYTLGNTITPKASTSQKRELAELALYSYFDLSWKNYLYLNATVRNQWSSTIPSTGQNSYLYPSVQLSTLVNEYIPMPDFINFFKLRGSLASVGSAFSPYKFSPVLTQGQSWNNNISMTTPSSLFDRNIKPSFSTGYEVGAEIRLFQNRLAFDAAYFYFVDGPQTYDQPISKGSGWTTVVMNGRKDLRKGWELTVSGSPIQNPKGFSWDVMFNISSYQKYLHELPEGQTQVGYIKVGERLDAIYGSAMMYAPEGSKYVGQMIIGSNGNVQKDNISQLLGYANNNFLLGFSNTFKYKNWGLNFLLDACVGGKIRSQYERYMYAGGKSLGISDVDRENWYAGKKYVAQGVMVTSGKLERDGNGNVISDTREFAPNTIETNYFDYIQQYKGYYGIDEACLVNRSYMKLRELVLTYNLPKFGKNSIIKNANISLVGRNLFLITASGLMDPDQFPESSTWDNLQTPSFRNIGVNFNLSF